MATRKPLFLGDYGSEEMATTDDIALGGLAMSGNITMGTNKITGLGSATSSGDALAYGQSGASLAGLTLTSALAMGTNKITGLGAGTVATDAVNKGQLDTAVINGGQVKELVLHENQLDDAEGVLAAVALTMVSNPQTGDTIVITDGTTTRTYGAGTGGDVQYTIGATVADSMTNLAAAIVGDGSAIWEAYFSTDLDAIDTDGVVVIVEDDNDGSASSIYGTWGTQANCQIVDFGGETQYTKKTLTNLPSSVPGSTNFGFNRTQSALTPGEIHTIENLDQAYIWDDDADAWQAMTGAGAIPDATSASGGGVKGKVTFDSDYGLVVSSGIAAISLATDPGLEFSSGDLQVKINSSAGIERTSSGIGIDLAASNPGLQFDGSGDLEALVDGVTISKATSLNVLGVPLQFTINSVATSTNVTAANLNELTGGSSTTLHTHAIGASNRIEDELTAEETLAQGDAVEWGTTNNQIRECQASVTSRIDAIGVVEESGGISASSTGTVVRRGVAVGVISAATVGDRYYVGDSGGLVSGIGSVSAGNHVIFIGTAKNATDLEVKPQYIGKKAA
ncbi:MAG: hypothetical protein BV456_03120 [Thermoplasmata archaeon M8B2D]|nr:MAG: hypothetical protein BV456_03120 [Thermoplasmata archaeon M8B2D]